MSLENKISCSLAALVCTLFPAVPLIFKPTSLQKKHESLFNSRACVIVELTISSLFQTEHIGTVMVKKGKGRGRGDGGGGGGGGGGGARPGGSQSYSQGTVTPDALSHCFFYIFMHRPFKSGFLCISQCCGFGSVYFWPPESGSVSVSQRYGSGSFCHQAKNYKKP
jgi:hypothetical protein